MAPRFAAAEDIAEVDMEAMSMEARKEATAKEATEIGTTSAEKGSNTAVERGRTVVEDTQVKAMNQEATVAIEGILSLEALITECPVALEALDPEVTD